VEVEGLVTHAQPKTPEFKAMTVKGHATTDGIHLDADAVKLIGQHLRISPDDSLHFMPYYTD
jgi:hypothetical protein